jgi:hypothetical protein
MTAATLQGYGLRAEVASLRTCAQHARRIAEEILDMETIEEGVFVPPRKVDNMRPTLVWSKKEERA